MQVLLIQGLHFLFSLFNIVQLCYIIHGYRLERNYEENYYYEKIPSRSEIHFCFF